MGKGAEEAARRRRDGRVARGWSVFRDTPGVSRLSRILVERVSGRNWGR
jgi:hypothetical protein